jgi:CDP-diacylglycerol--glycerol-3-phosphate 3-phosphatidyltransferase
MNKIKKNIPNIITISRIISSISASILFILGNIPVAIGLYIYGAVSDCLDGLAARKLNAFTELGRKLDPISDKIYALSLLIPSLALGNYLMAIPLVLESSIASTTITAKKSNIKIETERVGKYKTWFLFATIILGLIATKFPIAYIPLAPLLGYTAHFQLQSIKSYENQYYQKLNKTNNNISKEKQEPQTHTKNKQIKNQIKNHYDELMFYQNIPIDTPSQTKPKTHKLVKRKNN